MRRVRTFRSLFVVFAVLAGSWTNSGWCQIPRSPRDTVRISGKIKAISSGMLQVIGEEGDQWVVGISPRTESIVMHATTSIDALQPGALVKLTADFDAQGYAKEPVGKLQVVTLSEKNRPGIFPPEADAGREKDKEKDKGDDRGKDGKGKGRGAPKGKETGKELERGKGVDPAEKETPAGPVAGVARYTVLGQLQGLQEQRLVIFTGQKSVQVAVSPETTVELEQVDFRLAREGDSIRIDGWPVPGPPGQVLARRIEITGSKPIVVPDPRQQKSKPNKRTRNK
jgi:hypothetical protein